MKILIFILTLTVFTYGKPVAGPQELQSISNKEQHKGRVDAPQKLPRQDEDGDDGDDAGNLLTTGLGNLFGGSSASGSPPTVTGLLLNGLTGGLFAGFIPGETGQAVNNLYTQFTEPLNKFLEGQINAGVKQLLKTTIAPSKATSQAPSTQNQGNNVLVQEVAIQEVSPQQIPGTAGGQISSSGHTLISAQNLSQNKQDFSAQIQNNQFYPQQQNPFPQQQQQNQLPQQQQQNQLLLQQQNQLAQQQHNQFSQQLNNQFPSGGNLAVPVKIITEQRLREPFVTNLADLKYLNQGGSPTFTGNPTGRPLPQLQNGQSSTLSTAEVTTEDDDGDDGEDEDNNSRAA